MDIEKINKQEILEAPEKVFEDGVLTRYGKTNQSVFDRIGKTSAEFFEKLPKGMESREIFLKILSLLETDYFNNKNFEDLRKETTWRGNTFEELHKFLINNKNNKNILHRFLDDWVGSYENFLEAKRQKEAQSQKLNSAIAKAVIKNRQKVVSLLFQGIIKAVIAGEWDEKKAHQLYNSKIAELAEEISRDFDFKKEDIEEIIKEILDRFVGDFGEGTELGAGTNDEMNRLEYVERDIQELQELGIEQEEYKEIMVLFRNKIEEFLNQKIRLEDLVNIFPKVVEKFCEGRNKEKEIAKLEQELNKRAVIKVDL